MQKHKRVRGLARGALAGGWEGGRVGGGLVSMAPGTQASSRLRRLIPLVLCPVCYCPWGLVE